MRIDSILIDGYKNLNSFAVEFSEESFKNVLLGGNGFGKSNLLEAIVLIFRDLDLNNEPQFSYEIKYICRGNRIKVSYNKKKKLFNILINDKERKKSYLRGKDSNGESKYLPMYVFAYYSGPSKRMENHFEEHQRKFYRNMREGNDEAFRSFFYSRDIHSQFVLLSFLTFSEENDMDFLKDYLSIKEIMSVTFVIKRPYWDSESKDHYSLEDFWGAKGVVRDFLDRLINYSFMPFQDELDVKGALRPKKEPVTYLHLRDSNDINNFAQVFGDKKNFFKHLESLYLSDLIREVNIKVKKTDDSEVTYSELSEGEQQLVTVLGLLKFTKNSESLFLLDEPDTHLNPKWKLEYLKLLEDVVDTDKNSHLIISTHDPLVIGGLRAEEVIVFDKTDDKLHTFSPDFDPKGIGVAGLLTSEIFGLKSTLDIETQLQLDRKRLLTYRDRNEDEEREFKELEEELGLLDYTRRTRDPLYEKFLEILFSNPEYQNLYVTEDQEEEFNKISEEIIAQIIKEEK